MMGLELKDKFLVRTPKLSYTEYCWNNEKFNEVVVNDQFLESLLNSSENVFNLARTKKKFNIYENTTLRKYYLRSIVRTTPFGMFSGIGIGSFKNTDDLLLNNKIDKYLRVDMEWLYKIINELECKLDNNLMVIWNKNCLDRVKKEKNTWLTCFTKKKSSEIIIDKTNAIDLVIQNAKEYTSKENLIKVLMNEYEANFEIIKDFLDELISKDFLISNLRPNLLNKNQLNYILNIAKDYNCRDIKPLILKLDEIELNIEKYNKCKDNKQSYNILLSILNQMKSLSDSNKFTHLDMKSNYDKCSLSLEHKAEITDFCNFLMQNSNKMKSQSIETFKSSFLSKYGSTQIPLKLVFDEIKGIGIPNTTINNLSINDKLNNFIFDNYDSDEIDLSTCTVKENKEYKVKNFDITMYLANNKQFNYIISPLIGANENDKIFGRFKYIFSSDEYNLNKKNNSIDIVELSYIPKLTKMANVTQCYSNYDYILEYGSNCDNKKNITLNNICMCLEDNEIKFYNSITGKPVRFSISNMGNLLHAPRLFKVLIDLQNYEYNDIFFLIKYYKRLFNNALILPRLRYKKIVICPKEWHFSKDMVNIENIDLFSKSINNLFSDYNMPSKVFFGDSDTRLIIDIKNFIDINILYKEFKNKKNITLYENLFEEEELLTRDNNKRKYISEFIFSCENTSYNNIQIVEHSENNNIIYPTLSNWIYIKLFCYTELEEYIICNNILKMMVKFKDSIECAFFMRYKEEKKPYKIKIQTKR